MNKTNKITKKELETTLSNTLNDLVDETEAKQTQEKIAKRKEQERQTKVHKRQESSKKLVEREILHNLCMTMEQELKNNPEILL